MRCVNCCIAHLLSVKRDQAESARFLGKALVTWRRHTKLTLVKYQGNQLAVQDLQNRGYLNTAHHSDGEMSHQLP